MRADSESFVGRHAVAAYFVLTFGISWMGALAVAAPHLLRHEELPKLTGILMFPAMLLGPSFSGIFLAGWLDGRDGLKELFSRMVWGRVAGRWFLPLVVPPVLVLGVLLGLKTFLSPVFAPNQFWMGILFGVPAGLMEEIGWMGFAFPRMRAGKSVAGPGILLGVLWALWHLPVIDYLGSATPHGRYWFAFFLVFAGAMTAMRVLICWMYAGTKSVWICQLMHVSSTGSLVIFSAPRVTAGEEVFWYGVYGVALWVVAIVLSKLPTAKEKN